MRVSLRLADLACAQDMAPTSATVCKVRYEQARMDAKQGSLHLFFNLAPAWRGKNLVVGRAVNRSFLLAEFLIEELRLNLQGFGRFRNARGVPESVRHSIEDD